jgi:hypothetical protein
MGLTVTLTVQAGNVSRVYAATASVQTHKIEEMQSALEAMWRVTISACNQDEVTIGIRQEGEPETEEDKE